MTPTDHARTFSIEWEILQGILGVFHIQLASACESGSVATQSGLQNTVKLVDA
jgi:hypothetical protein